MTVPSSFSRLPTVSKVLRTPPECFAHLRGFDYTPHYLTLQASEGTPLRVSFIDEGPRNAPVVLLMHGEPTWSYLYRKMIPVLLAEGFRVVAPDMVGFGRSDKPASARDHSYAHQLQWMNAWLEQLDLRGITLFCQDWGSLIGLRMATAQGERFERIIVSNGGLPTGDGWRSRAFLLWRAFANYSPWFPIGRIVQTGCRQGLDKANVAAYDAPYPSAAYRAAPRVYPSLVPISPKDPESGPNEAAWQVLEQWHKPFVTLFSSGDPFTRGAELPFLARVPGARGQAHQIIRKAGHFVQEDQGPLLARLIAQLMKGQPILPGPGYRPHPSIA